MCRANWQSQRVRYFLRPAPHKAQMVSERESQGRHLDNGGGFTRKHDRRGRTANSHCILNRQRRLPKTLRDHVRSASALSALKKSLVANLSAKRQLSVAKLSAKSIFPLAKRNFFSRKWPDGGRFFEPWFFSLLCLCRQLFSFGLWMSVCVWPHGRGLALRTGRVVGRLDALINQSAPCSSLETNRTSARMLL